jgi:hypothetical protein
MQQQYTFECDCGKAHTSSTTATPSGWQVSRDGKPVCDDCVSAKSARRTRRAERPVVGA